MVLDEFVARGWLDERRYAGEFVRTRVARGEGPVRIAAELQQRGVDPELIAAELARVEDGWMERLREVWHKRFGGRPPRDNQERARQARFLRYRGFTAEQVSRVLNGRADEE